MKPDPLNKIISLDFSKTLAWSERKKRGSGFYEKKKRVRRVLELISGNNLIEMLRDVLNEEEKNKLNDKISLVLKNMDNIFKMTQPKKRHSISLAFRRARISLRKARNLGFKISSKLWKNCSIQEKRNKGGRKAIDSNLRKCMNNYLEKISEIASNRTIKIDNEEINVRYLNTSISEAYQNFERKNDISFSCFYSYVADNFKKPHRLTDLCEYCELGKKLKKELSKNTKILGLDLDNFLLQKEIEKEGLNFSIENIKEFLLKKTPSVIVNESMEKIKSLEYVQFHYKIAKRQRSCYKKMLSDTQLLKENLLIEIDYKQKILIGMSPRQTSGEYYKQQQRNLLGFGIHFTNEHNQIECINYDLVYDGDQKGSTTVLALKFMRSKEFFKKIDRKKYIIWCDTGSHFRYSEVVSFFLTELKNENIDVSVNFFGDKHGKNLRDQHFSTIANFIKRESFVKQLTSTADIVNAINTRQEISNQNRSLKGKKNITRKLNPIKTIADEFIASENQTNTFKKIQNIRCLYQFYAKAPDFLPMSTVFSDRDKSVEVKFIGGLTNSTPSNIEDEETISVEQVSLKSIIEKKKQIEAMFKNDLPKYCYNSKKILDLFIKKL